MTDRQRARKELEYLYQGDVHMIKDLDWLYDMFRQALSEPEWRAIEAFDNRHERVVIANFENDLCPKLAVSYFSSGDWFDANDQDELGTGIFEWKPTHWKPLDLTPPSESGK
jgi:hypothetical protein